MQSLQVIDVSKILKATIAFLLVSITGNIVQWKSSHDNYNLDKQTIAQYELRLKDAQVIIDQRNSELAKRDNAKKELELQLTELRKHVDEKQIKYVEVVKKVKVPEQINEQCRADYQILFDAFKQCDSLREDAMVGWNKCSEETKLLKLDISDYQKIISEQDKQNALLKNWNDELTKQRKKCNCGKACLIIGAAAFVTGAWLAH